MPIFADPFEDELACLNLSITAPSSCLDGSDQGASLPVLTFIHGGGLAGGSSSMLVGGRQLFDATNLFRTSIKLGKTMICVTLNSLDTLISLSPKKLAQGLPGVLVYPVMDEVWVTDSIWDN